MSIENIVLPSPLPHPPSSSFSSSLSTSQASTNNKTKGNCGTSFNFSTLNIYGNKISSVVHEITSYMKTHYLDCILLTEVYFENNDMYFKRFHKICSFSENKRGLVLLIEKKHSLLTQSVVIEGHCLYAKIKMATLIIDVFGIYGSADCNDTLSSNLMCKIYDSVSNVIKDGAKLLFGDFNCNMNNNSKPKTRAIIDNLLCDFDLSDIGKIYGSKPTWQGRGFRAGSLSRLDLVLTNLTMKKNQFLIFPTSSDHDLIIYSYFYSQSKNQANKTCKDYILNNDIFIEESLQAISKILVENSDQFIDSTISLPSNNVDINAVKKLDATLTFNNLEFSELTILNLVINEVKRIHDKKEKLMKNREKTELTQLYQKISFQKNKIKNNNLDDSAIKSLAELKDELKSYFHSKKERNNLTVQRYYLNQYGKINAKMFSEIKPSKKRKHIMSLDVSNGTTEDSKIISETLTQAFKENVATKRSYGNISDFISENDIDVKVDRARTQSFINPITRKEISDSLKKMQRISSPGISGTTKSFYEFLLFTIPTIFTKAVNCYINFGANSDIFAWIKLRKVIFIHKNNKKTNFPKDYRPISLLEVFYKIIAKTVINRLDSIGDEIFDPNQFGFVRKRSASCATKSIQIIQDHCKDTNFQLVFLDNCCAFDRLGLKPLLEILKCMDIPDIYIKWIKNLIENGNAFTFINNICSEIFTILSAAPQGSPMSSTLYAVGHNIMQKLYAKMNYSWQLNVKNIKVGLISFADDSSTAIKIQKKEDLETFFYFFDQFKDLLGLSLNVEKTEFLLYGNNTNEIAHWINELSCGKVSKVVRHLGIYINHDTKDTIKSTFEIIKQRMNDYVKFFVHTKVDMFKRKVLLELAIHSQFNHLFQSCQINEKLLNTLWKDIVNVLWARKFPINRFSGRRLIAIDRLPACFSVGGLKLTPTAEKYKRLSIESNFKVLKNVFFGKKDFISMFIGSEIPDFKLSGSKGLMKIANDLPTPLQFLKETLIFLSKLVLTLENSSKYFSGASVFNSKYNGLFFKLNSSESTFFKENKIFCLGQLIMNKDDIIELKPSLGPKISLIISHLEKSFIFKRVLSVNHLHLIFDTYTEVKEFRPKFILKKKFEEKMNELKPIAPSYNTRIKDKVFALQDVKIFKNAYRVSMKFPLSTIYKTFNIQILNRTLYTSQKAIKWKIPGETGHCVKCSENEDTSHLLIDCDKYAYPLWVELNSSLKSISPQPLSDISWLNIIYHKNLNGLDHEKMKQLLILMQIVKYGIYSKRAKKIIYSSVRLRAHLIIYCNRAIDLHSYIGKTSYFLKTLKECIEIRLINNTDITRRSFDIVN
jgi:hypothetical protein